MKKILCALLFIAFTAGSAHALGAGASLGVFVPQGKAIEDYSPGFGASVWLEDSLLPLIKLRLAANFSQADYDKNGTELRYTSQGGQLLAIATAPIPVVNLYAGAGYGLYKNKIADVSKNYRDPGNTYNEYGHGAVFKAGVGMSFTILYIGLEGQYLMNAKSEDKFDGFSLGLGVGLSI